MCNYGQGHMIGREKIDEILQRIASGAEGADSILVGTLGSIFDREEMPQRCLEMICTGLNRIPVHTIIFETHYSFVSLELCQWLRDMMPDKDIVIELGLESVDSFVQKRCLNKSIQLAIFKEKIELIHKTYMSVTVNVFLGSPFLTVKKQIEDVEKTILWAIENGVDSTTIFPANIRKGTLLDELYQNGKYKRITQWQVLEVLKKIPEDYLNRIFISWYGDWIDRDEGGEVENLPPYACNQCRTEWMKFYHEFLSGCVSEQRKKLLREFAEKMGRCLCRCEFEEDLYSSRDEEESIPEIPACVREYVG